MDQDACCKEQQNVTSTKSFFWKFWKSTYMMTSTWLKKYQALAFHGMLKL